jgi:hypothetical protein
LPQEAITPATANTNNTFFIFFDFGFKNYDRKRRDIFKTKDFF